MNTCNLGTVLIPGGPFPLEVLLQLAMERNEEIPTLIYEARLIHARHGKNWGPNLRGKEAAWWGF
jgi:hypothetical protein